MKNPQKNINHSWIVMCTKGVCAFHNIIATHFNSKLHITHVEIKADHNTLSFMWEICFSSRILIHVLHSGHLVRRIFFFQAIVSFLYNLKHTSICSLTTFFEMQNWVFLWGYVIWIFKLITEIHVICILKRHHVWTSILGDFNNHNCSWLTGHLFIHWSLLNSYYLSYIFLASVFTI